ncbi:MULTISPECIES: ABC transporter substrate-binding protein [unclassified Paenibacillus]|uniref:ABC transporter substrate-binding protein n=1 Tax=unclassified Paenibacillus TaxID=185978 RepID=UPI0019DD029E|nr:ABC transporter substrate-binding protein [Paenibacillus sp. Y412MC10]
MPRQKKWTFLAAPVCLMMVIAACSSGGGGNTSSPSATSSTETASASDNGIITDWSKQPEMTLTVFDTLANYAGEQPGWFAKLIKDKFNIKLNIVAPNLSGGAQMIATQMASGDLGDLVVGLGGKDYENAIKAGMILDWTKDGLLDKYGKNLEKYAAQALDANKKQYGGGTAIYGIGHNVGTGDGPSEGADMTFGPMLRWDLYQKLGSPQIKTLDDYLPILKKMQEMDPKSDSGKKTYGMSLWSDWDGDWSTLAKVTAQFYGYAEGDTFNPGDMILTKADGPEYQGFLDDNSYYMQGLEFYFKANQMGLLDPDSLTQKFGDVSNKFKDGQVLFSQFPWISNVYNTPDHTSAGKGFVLVPFQDEKVYSSGFNPYGGSLIWSIGSHAKDPARVLAFVDWLFSPDGVQETNIGPKGLAWDIGKDGKPVLTDFGKKATTNGDTPVPAQYGGGTWRNGVSQLNNSTLTTSQINPNTGAPYDSNLWNSTLTANPDPVTKSWREAMGVTTSKELFVKNNQVAVTKPFFNGQPSAQEPSDIKLKHTQVGKVIKEYSWKMMFAKDQSEFDQLKQQMVQKAKGLGYDDVVNWEVQQTKNTVFTMYK